MIAPFCVFPQIMLQLPAVLTAVPAAVHFLTLYRTQEPGKRLQKGVKKLQPPAHFFTPFNIYLLVYTGYSGISRNFLPVSHDVRKPEFRTAPVLYSSVLSSHRSHGPQYSGIQRFLIALHPVHRNPLAGGDIFVRQRDDHCLSRLWKRDA